MPLPDVGTFQSSASLSSGDGLGAGLPPTTLPPNLPATLPDNALSNSALSNGALPTGAMSNSTQPDGGLPSFPGTGNVPASNSQLSDTPLQSGLPASSGGQPLNVPSLDTQPAPPLNAPSYGAADDNYSLSDPYSNTPAGYDNSMNQRVPSNQPATSPPATANPYRNPGTEYSNGVPSYNGGVTTAASTQILPPNDRGTVDINRQPYLPNQEAGANQLRASNDRRLGNELRQGASNPAQLQPARQPPVHTGLPFVTDRPRRGTYPTSTYNPALFQMAAYQRAVNANNNANSNARNTTPGQLVSQTQPLVAQNQPLTSRTGVATGSVPQQGFYPTAYVSCDAPTPSFPSNGAVNGTFAPPTYAANVNPGLYTPNNAGYTPLFSLGQENYNVQLGRGIIGQPTVYVPGQPIRNFLRYLSP